jgi:hypothetical protein
MIKRYRPRVKPLPREFLEWQVALRRHTMLERQGAPHAGVAPLVTVRRPGPGIGVASHAVICGVLPREELLEEKTKAFRRMYEEGIAAGARAVYDRGIEYLRDYYAKIDDFDPASLTTLLASDLPVVDALRADPRCALLFYVFELEDQSELHRFRCLQIEAVAEVLREGAIYENVWWHNALFHGTTDGCVAIRFSHLGAADTSFGRWEELAP